MAFDAKVVLDSISPTGARLTTLELTYPRFIHSEVLTHRDRARNSASSRAIPWPKMMERIERDPVVPILWGAEQRGMQTGGEIGAPFLAETEWLMARNNAVASARALAALGVHKSIVNRLTEPFMWITTIMSATEWKNFFRLRCHPDAEIHFQKIAGMARDAIEASTPMQLPVGGWHMPYITDEEREACMQCRMSGVGDVTLVHLARCSVARCARVSYLTHDGEPSIDADVALYEKLVNGSGFGHWSPHEHVAMALEDPRERSGPYRGWRQFRKIQPGECADG